MLADMLVLPEGSLSCKAAGGTDRTLDPHANASSQDMDRGVDFTPETD